jgi:hypothetical protein
VNLRPMVRPSATLDADGELEKDVALAWVLLQEGSHVADFIFYGRACMAEGARFRCAPNQRQDEATAQVG